MWKRLSGPAVDHFDGQPVSLLDPALSSTLLFLYTKWLWASRKTNGRAEMKWWENKNHFLPRIRYNVPLMCLIVDLIIALMVNVSHWFIISGAPSNVGGVHIGLFHPGSLSCADHSSCWEIHSDIWLNYYSPIRKNKQSESSLTWLCSVGSLLLSLVLVNIALVCLSVNRLFCCFYTCTCTAGRFLNDFWKPGCFQSTYGPRSCCGAEVTINRSQMCARTFVGQESRTMSRKMLQTGQVMQNIVGICDCLCLGRVTGCQCVFGSLCVVGGASMWAPLFMCSFYF